MPVVFEAEDPAYWIPHGYVVIMVDARGFGRSPGTITMPSVLASASLPVARYGIWARDMYDAIEWADVQP